MAGPRVDQILLNRGSGDVASPPCKGVTWCSLHWPYPHCDVWVQWRKGRELTHSRFQNAPRGTQLRSKKGLEGKAVISPSPGSCFCLKFLLQLLFPLCLGLSLSRSRKSRLPREVSWGSMRGKGVGKGGVPPPLLANALGAPTATGMLLLTYVWAHN